LAAQKDCLLENGVHSTPVGFRAWMKTIFNGWSWSSAFPFFLMCFRTCDARFAHFADIKNYCGLVFGQKEKTISVGRKVRVSNLIPKRLLIQLRATVRIIDAQASCSKIQGQQFTFGADAACAPCELGFQLPVGKRKE
jgi:hypothetical protein